MGVEQESMEFAEFYESARDDCLRIVLLNVGDRQLAEDLVAEAFTRAWMSWRKVRELQAPQGWVVRTALNAHVSWWRRHRLTGLAGAAVVAVGTGLAVTALLPASHVASHQPRIQLAAWTVVKQPGGIIHVTVHELRNPAGLQATLRTDGVPASVSFGNGQQTACRPYPGGGFMTSANPALINSIFPGPGVNIRPSALPSHTGVLLAFLRRSHPRPGLPVIAIEVAVVQASQQCTGS
jgi:hypothetical protein